MMINYDRSTSELVRGKAGAIKLCEELLLKSTFFLHVWQMRDEKKTIWLLFVFGTKTANDCYDNDFPEGMRV